MMNNSMSVYYAPVDFKTSTRVIGNAVANDGLLKAVINYGTRSAIAPYIAEPEYFDEFQNKYDLDNSFKTYYPIMKGDIPALKQTGLYMHPGIWSNKMAWARSYIGPDSFSICGLTHAIAGMDTAEEVAQLIQAPVHDWDAIICTSIASKRVMEQLFSQWTEYLSARYKTPVNCNIQLPLIPLGIHPEDIAAPELHEFHRSKFRKQYGIGEKDYVVLFVGRLWFYEKAHPIPMYLALEALAQRIGSHSKVYFVQAGWFPEERHKTYYQQAAKLFCPSVKVIFINDLNTEEKKKAIWPGADVFLSLSDNIQESFGITPLEAMANKLPVVVSDWDGYRDTVRHGVDGFLIPTVLPPSGCGVDLSLGYLTKAINWKVYAGFTSQMTSIDLGACIEALWQLYQNPELKHQMGQAGCLRVQEHYQWRKVITQYDALWNELEARRYAATAEAKKNIAIPPMLADPFHTFSGYASKVLKPNCYFKLGLTSSSQLETLTTSHLGSIGVQQLVSIVYLKKIIEAIHQKTMSTDDLVRLITNLDRTVSPGVIVRSLTYLMKYDFIRMSE